MAGTYNSDEIESEVGEWLMYVSPYKVFVNMTTISLYSLDRYENSRHGML